MGKPLLRIENIHKEFPGVKALDNILFEVEKGEVHAIVGENGAGKSTLMNILSGVYTPTKGKIYFEQNEMNFRDPKHAQEAGIGMIHQELSLATNLTVMENIYLGRYPKNKLGLIDYKLMYEKCLYDLSKSGITNISPNEVVGNLSLSEMQMVEIVKALSLKVKLIIMDEPTASLTQKEIRNLMEIITGLKEKGISVLYISHKMEEIFEITDTITVLRDGKYIETIPTKDTTQQQVISSMVGREFNQESKQKRNTNNSRTESEVPILEVKNFTVGDKVKNVNFSLYSGEIIAIAGLVGAGRSELVQGIFGLEKNVTGQLYVDGKEVKIKSPIDAIRLGMGLVPEGRKSQGLLLEMSVKDNITISKLNQNRKRFFVDKNEETKDSLNYIKSLSIRTPSLNQEIQYLSGGNQQKCIFSRWLLNNPNILILDEPTHGVDVGAKYEIYRVIESLAKENVGIIVISSELPEVLTLADRILVLNEGELTKEIGINEANQEKIMKYAT